MDFRKHLFKLERFSPQLAKKFWSITQYRFVPVLATMGLQLANHTDDAVEVRIPGSRQNRDENGDVSNVVFWGAADYCCRAWLSRHLAAYSYAMKLTESKQTVINQSGSACKARIQILESEREILLRKIKSGQQAVWDAHVSILNEKDQQVSNLNLVWKIESTRPIQIASGGR